MVSSRRWIRDLPAGAAAEIDAALQAVRRRGLAWHEIRREDFPLPTLRPLFDDIADELENGCGMVKLRGLPVAAYDEDALRQIYFGIGSHVGTPVFQNRRGELMRAIRDEGAGVGQRYGQIEGQGDGRPFLSSYARTLTNGQLRFHTDRTDVVALLCVRQAKSGGVSKICSSTAVHNAFLARRPDLLDVLFEDFWRSRLGEESDKAETVYRLPIFGLRDGRFTSHYSLTYIEAAELVPGVPKLTTGQREAIDMLMALSEELCFEMTLEPGDLQLLNSHVTYHGRTAFEDDKASGHDRLLLRLWLTMPNNRALPQGHEVLWGNIAAGARRGGIGQTVM
ncbi:MAG: TauD/TfdA family dioxygenase [Alphaproteobacteria bacterium]|nr:TauD/TfdA family dioxygenase [Alphaproteobacteria bacterium]